MKPNPLAVVLFVFAALLSTACRSTGVPRALSANAEYFKPAVRVYFDTGHDDAGELDVFKDGSLTAAVDFLGVTFPFLVHAGKDDATVQKAVDAAKSLQDAAEHRLAESAARSAEAERADKGNLDAAGARDAQVKLARAETLLARQEADEAAKRVEKAEKKQMREGGTMLDGDWIVGPRIAVGLTTPAGDDGDATTTSDQASGAPVVYVSAGLFADFNKGGMVSDGNGTGVRLEAGIMLGISADESLTNADDSAFYVGMTVVL